MKSIKIKSKEYKIKKEFPVMHSGWECDSIGYIAEDPKGHSVVILTNHGSPYLADSKELVEKIEEYQSVLNQTKEALYSLS